MILFSEGGDEIEIDDDLVLEHHGVKGMHWGQRRAARKEARRKQKFDNQKPIVVREQTAIKVGGYAATLVGARVVSRVAAQRGGTAMSLLAGGATLAIGHQLTQSAAARYGDRHMNEFTQPPVRPEA